MIKKQRIYNDKAESYPQYVGKFINFRIFIEFFIHEVKNTFKFLVGIGAVFVKQISIIEIFMSIRAFLCKNI